MEKADFVSVKEYTLDYGHNGKHVKIIRTRYDKDYISTILFHLIELDLVNPRLIVPRLISEENVMKVFKQYYPEIFESIVHQFIRGELI